MTERRIVAIALVTRDELARLGPAFRRAWPVEDGPCFAGLLQAIDEADRDHWREQDSTMAEAPSVVQPFPYSDRT